MPYSVTRINPEFRVNTTTAGAQSAPAITSLVGGGFVATWTSFGQDGSLEGVYGQRYDATGTAVGSEFRVNTVTAGAQSDSAAASLSDGGFVVTWTSDQEGADGLGIYGQRYNSAGVAVGGEFHINTTAAGAQINPSIAGLPGGGFVATWSTPSGQAGRTAIAGQRYDASGAPAGGEFTIAGSLSDVVSSPSVSPLASGGYVVTWTNTRLPSEAEYDTRINVVSQRYDAAGVAVGGQLISATNLGTASISDSTVVGLSGGGFVVTWTGRFDGSASGINGQRYDSAGVPAGAQFMVNSTTADAQIESAIATLPGGGFIVTWSSNLQDGSGYGVYAQRYDASGAASGSEIMINAYTTGDQRSSAVAALNDGFATVWTSNGQDGSGLGVYGRVFNDAQQNVVLSAATELVTGTSGDDIILVAPGALGAGDVVDGGAGLDTLRLTAAGTLDTSVAGPIIRNIERLEGSSGDDVIVGDNQSKIFVGGGGSDLLQGGFGADVFLLGSAADSTLAKSDLIVNFFRGQDALDLTALGSGARVTTAVLNGSTYVYADVNGDGAQDSLVVLLNQTAFGTDILTSGSAGLTMFGDASANLIFGTNRADIIIAGDGADQIGGGKGADQFYGGAGADTYYLEIGDNSTTEIDVCYDFASGSDILNVAALTGQGAKLTIAIFEGSTFVYIDQNADGNADGEFIAYKGALQGSDLFGLTNLTMYGSSSGETLQGYIGNDVIAGFGGDDVIIGGGGADQLYGGAGADTFRYLLINDSFPYAYDYIQDFQVGVDKIDIRALNTNSGSKYQLSSFNGATFVYVDLDGNGTQDFLVIASGVTLTAADIQWTASGAPDDASAPAAAPIAHDDHAVVCPAPVDADLAWML